jgi:nicotinic acid phosphoribosyltransferase
MFMALLFLFVFIYCLNECLQALHASSESAATANESELAAFTAYAQSFPNGFLALVDTYDTLER